MIQNIDYVVLLLLLNIYCGYPQSLLWRASKKTPVQHHMFYSQIKSHNLCFSTRHTIFALFSGHASISTPKIIFAVCVHKRTLNVRFRAIVILKYQILHIFWRILSRVHVHNLHPGANFHRVQICTPLCRVHMPMNCVHTHLDLIRNLTQGTHFYEKFAVFECYNWQLLCIISVYVCQGKGGGGGGFLDISTAECVVETFTLHSYKGQIRKAYS